MKEIVAIRQGDETVFEQVYEMYHEKLYFSILKTTSSSYLAEETVQLAFIKLWLYRQSLSVDIPIEAQIFRIARTSLIDLLRKNANQRRIIENMKDVVPVTDEHVMSALVKKETGERIAALIEGLPPIRKKVFKLSREQGLSYKEIAQELSLTPKNVENHISKAIKQLRKALHIAPVYWLLMAGHLLVIIFRKNIF